ncbi:MAG: undecaprenyl diphosphate synthase family protein [Acidobacteriaceae bacterium]
MQSAERATAESRRLLICVAIDYSSRHAIERAVLDAAACLSRDRGSPADNLRSRLAGAITAETEDVDLLIRTGGEKRLSDFLLWESAYAELLFTERMWPDFDKADLDDALREFRQRQRRYGGLPAVASDPRRVSSCLPYPSIT